jgi:hypothetical protein
VLFDGSPKPKQIVLAPEWIGQARPKLMELIGSLAGVTKRQSSRPVDPQPKTWPKQARQIERDQGIRLIETLKEFSADASLAGDPLVGPTFVRKLL